MLDLEILQLEHFQLFLSWQWLPICAILLIESILHVVIKCHLFLYSQACHELLVKWVHRLIRTQEWRCLWRILSLIFLPIHYSRLLYWFWKHSLSMRKIKIFLVLYLTLPKLVWFLLLFVLLKLLPKIFKISVDRSISFHFRSYNFTCISWVITSTSRRFLFIWLNLGNVLRILLLLEFRLWDVIVVDLDSLS